MTGGTTEISEIFSSIQGEGPYTGKKQIFVRFGRCNMHCVYCDETDKMKPGGYHTVSGESVLERVLALEKSHGPHHSVSMTGGEPLLYAGFLKNFLPDLKSKGFTTYLETNGTLPLALGPLLPFIDIVAMDLKPPSSTQDRSYLNEHKAFIAAVKNRPAAELFVKIVVTPDTLPAEISECLDLLREIDPELPVIFQPVSESAGISRPAILHIEENILNKTTQGLADVRVLPQMHKIWGVR